MLALTLVSLAFSIRIINSISLIMLVVVTIIHHQRFKHFKKAFSNPYFLCCLFLFIIKAMGIFYSDHASENIRQISNKGIWLAIPFFFCANNELSAKTMSRLMIYFSASLLIVLLYCFFHAIFIFNKQHDPSVFFYHDFVRPFRHHAVLFSFYLFFCIIYWLEQGIWFLKTKKTYFLAGVLITIFYCSIFLLSSKLVIALSLIYCLYVIIRKMIVSGAFLLLSISVFLFIVMASAVLFTNNPISNRFSDAVSGNGYLFKQEQFSPATYFNGVQLRLLIWRFTYEILEEKNAWIMGVSSGDAQFELNKKYAEANVYLGDGINDKKGYQVFNCHNVFLQTTLESGLFGLVILLTLIAIFLAQAFFKRDSFAIIFYIAILAFCFTESVLSSQYSILLFMFFPLLSLNVRRVP